MKLDSEPVVYHSTLEYNHDFKAIKNKGGVLESTETKAIVEENKNVNFCDANGCDSVSDLERFVVSNGSQCGRTPELDSSLAMDNFTNGKEVDGRDFIVPCSISSELFKDTDLYADKTVMEPEMPELMICYKESIYHVVKDICVDEGVHCTDKILVESRKNDTDLLKEHLDTDHGFMNSDAYKHSDLLKEHIDSDIFILDEYKGSLETNINKGDPDNDSAINCHSESGTAHCNGTNKPMKDTSAEEFILREFGTEKSLKALLSSPICGGEELERQSDQLPFSESPATVSVAEELSNQQGETSPSNGEVESGKITSDVNYSSPASNSRGESPEHVSEEPHMSQSLPDKDGGISDGLSAAKLIERVEGESSFSLAGSMSGLITYSGPLPYSGSISIRSDSSTTSTRSFAFPILQSEWNTSPVRMAEANRKHRGWRHGLFCCKF